MRFHELKLVSRTDNFWLKLHQLVCYSTVLFGMALQKVHWQPHWRMWDILAYVNTYTYNIIKSLASYQDAQI